MVEQTLWTERTFSFGIPPGWMPNVLERLRGTSVRLRDLTANLSEAQTSIRPEGKWSIKEHIGHLSDLEELHTGRLDDFITREKILRAADMSNAKTEGASHHEKSLQKLLNDFSIKRRHFIHRLSQLDEDTCQFASKHPRLKKMMKPVDIAYFTAEHDDHHLAGIRRIVEVTL
jgi:hypothetical protein